MSTATQKTVPVLSLLGRKSMQAPRQEPQIPYFADDDDDGINAPDMMLGVAPATAPTTATQLDEFAEPEAPVPAPAPRRESKAERRARKQAARRHTFVTEHSSEDDTDASEPYVAPAVIQSAEDPTPSVDAAPEPILPDTAPVSDAPVTPSGTPVESSPAAVAVVSAFPEAPQASRWVRGLSLVRRIAARVYSLLKRVDWVALVIFAAIPLMIVAAYQFGALPVVAVGTSTILVLAVVRMFAGDVFTSLFFTNRTRFLKVLFQASLTLGLGLLLILSRGAVWEVLVSVVAVYLFATRSLKNARS